jgi:hypothetical protein
MTNKKSSVLFILILLTLNFLIIPTFAWWNTSWQYRKPINISNTAGDLTNYQIPIYFGEKPIIDKLVGYWKLDEGSGTTTHDTSMWKDGIKSYGLDFDGVDDYIDLGTTNGFNLVMNFTISAWIKPDSFGDPSYPYLRILSRRIDTPTFGGYELMLNNGSGTERMSLASPGIGSASSYNNTITLGVWQHITVVDQAGTIKFYIDGVYEGGGSVVINSKDSIKAVIGDSSNNLGCCGFNGTIDEVQIYNRVLSEEEINKSFCIGAYKLNHSGQNFPYPSWCDNYIKSYSYSWQDLRFTNSSGSELNYWLENDRTV